VIDTLSEAITYCSIWVSLLSRYPRRSVGDISEL
jgi:hypothetical protein